MNLLLGIYPKSTELKGENIKQQAENGGRANEQSFQIVLQNE